MLTEIDFANIDCVLLCHKLYKTQFYNRPYHWTCFNSFPATSNVDTKLKTIYIAGLIFVKNIMIFLVLFLHRMLTEIDFTIMIVTSFCFVMNYIKLNFKTVVHIAAHVLIRSNNPNRLKAQY